MRVDEKGQPSTVAVVQDPAIAKSANPSSVLAVLCVAAFMASLDLFIVNVAFDDIGHSFSGVALSDLSWVLNGYAIVYAAALVPLGRLADRYGRKAGFLGGLALFTAASAACAVSDGVWMLVSFRALQAIGAAALTPTSLGLLLTATPPERRMRAVRMWAASGALASAAGPVIGGLLVEASWRWVFLVNVPVGIAAIVVALRQVPDSRDTTVTRIPDLLGAGVLAVAIGALAYGLVEGPSRGWAAGTVLTAFAVAALGVAGFWLRTTRHPSPVVEPALLRVRAFAWSNVTAVLFSAAFAAGLLSMVLWLQQVWSYSAIRTGLAIAPGPLMVPLSVLLGSRYLRRLPPGLVASAGCFLFACGSGLTGLSIGRVPHYAAEVLPGWLLTGVGVGLALPTILTAATADLPPSRNATGSAVVTMSRQIGSVLGVGVFVAVVGTTTGFAQAHHAFQHGWLVITLVGLAGAVTAVGMTPAVAAPSETRSTIKPSAR